MSALTPRVVFCTSEILYRTRDCKHMHFRLPGEIPPRWGHAPSLTAGAEGSIPSMP